MTVNTYLEATEDDSLQQFVFNQQGGGGGGLYQFGSVQDDDPITSIDDLQGAITDILGYTDVNGSGSQKLSRTVPTTHPAFPYLYANALGGMQGKGTKLAEEVADVFPPVTSASEAIANFYLYQDYQIKVNFATRPYMVLLDNQVNINSSSWVPDSGGSPVSFTYAAEWMRYVDYDVIPQYNLVQGQTGQLIFNSSISGGIDGTQFTSPPFIYMPDSIIKIKWFEVPYRYITSHNSFIANRGWYARINQNAFWNWPAGSLLYLSYSVNKYNPPNLNTQTLTDLNGNSWLSYAKLCDIEFTFLYTQRTITSGTTARAPTNGNYIVGGHNLQPYISGAANVPKGFYFADSGPDNGSYPAFKSFPMEILFSDPDQTGGP